MTQAIHFGPCDPSCPVHFVANPVEGDVWNLQRFIEAQNEGEIFDLALSQLRQRKKKPYSHWMWFIFPQVVGLGGSPKSTRFGIRCLDEARAFLNHPILGERLEECCSILARGPRKTAKIIFGEVDAKKFRSSLTLFAFADLFNQSYLRLLKRYFAGKGDWSTLKFIIDELVDREQSNENLSKLHLTSHGNKEVQLQNEFRNGKFLNLSCQIDSHGNFVLAGHDFGGGSEYEWQTIISQEEVPLLRTLLSRDQSEKTDLINLLERDWKPIYGDGLEKIIRLSGIKFEFSNYQNFP